VAKFYLNRLLSRRQVLTIGLSTVTALAILSLGKLKVLSYLIYTLTNQQKIKDNERRTFRVVGKNSLKKRARAKGLIYGAYPQADRQNFDDTPKLKSNFIKECDLLVAGFYMDRIRPNAGTFNFAETDYFAQFAANHKMLLRGTPLVWHLSLPNWISATLNSQNAEQILTNHLQTVIGHYVGKMHSWDVVNEAIDLQDGRSDGLRNSPWLKFLGPDYIEQAFRIAARSDPHALLVYNETGLEYSEDRQHAVFKLLQQLKSKGTPVHALGVQSHLEGDRYDFNPQQFSKFLRNVANLGLKIMITELDVLDNNLPLDASKRDRTVAINYEDYLSTVLAEKSVIAVINWGLSDLHTWVTDFYPRKDRFPARPLPLDRNFKPKLAWNAIARAFDRAPKR
jgi:endo-1,4-beta-xylanase